MLRSNYLCGLDIGSCKIAAVAAKVKKKKVESVFFETGPSRGVSHGTIVNALELTSAVEAVLKALRRRSGLPLSLVYVDISGQGIITRHSHAIIPLAERGNKVIFPTDIERVNEQARILASNLEDEIIEQVPFGYTIDSRTGILNPLGLYSHKLQTDLFLLCAKISSVQSLTRVINQAGFQVREVFFSGAATAEAVLSENLRKARVVLCDIGADTTELLLFEGGHLRHIDCLAMGGRSVTERLSTELQIPLELAEEVKVSHGVITDPATIDEAKEVLVKREGLYRPIALRHLVRIVNEESGRLAAAIKEAIERCSPTYRIDTVIVCGCQARQEGLLELLETTLEVPVAFGRVANPDLISLLGAQDRLAGDKYLSYMTALGIICKALKSEYPQVFSGYKPSPNPLVRAMNRVKTIYQEYF